MRTALLFAMPLAAGCTFFTEFQAIQDHVDGLLNPLMVQGMVIGVEEPESEAVRELLAFAGYESGTSASVFLADADDEAGALVPGA